MTSTTVPVRRSALEAVHERIGGGTDPGLRWPMSYGDPDGERRALKESVGLAEPGLYDKWLLRGNGALVGCRAAGLDGLPGFVTPAAPGGVNVWAIAADEVWLTAYAPIPDGPPIAAVDFGAIVDKMSAAGATATDVSSGWAVLRVAGPRSRALLEELVAEDLGAGAVADQRILAVPLGGCRVLLSRRDAEGIPGFTMLVGRDDAEYLWSVFMEVGSAHGIRPVGAAALLGTPAAGAAR